MYLLTIDPEATLREAAQRMSERDVGAVLVVEPTGGSQPAIITERDMLHSIAEGQDPDSQRVGDKTTADVATISIDSSLDEAVEKMMRGDFRHLVVIQGAMWWASSRCEMSRGPWQASRSAQPLDRSIRPARAGYSPSQGQP